MSQPQLAQASGVSQSQISTIEGADEQLNLTTDILLPLERALQLIPGELMALLHEDVAGRSREAFIEGHRKLLSEDDIYDLRRMNWFGPGEDPPDIAWMGVVHARQLVRKTKKSGP